MITTRCNTSAAKYVLYALAVNDEYTRYAETAILMCNDEWNRNTRRARKVIAICYLNYIFCGEYNIFILHFRHVGILRLDFTNAFYIIFKYFTCVRYLVLCHCAYVVFCFKKYHSEKLD